VRIASIVEGHGEVQAVPILLRRLAEAVDPALVLETPRPIRVPREKLKKANELERAVELAARRVEGRGGVLVLIDSEDDCPKDLAPELVARAKSVRKDVPIAVILAKREYEAWFLAAAVSLRGKRGLAPDLVGPGNPEDVRGAKEWLSERMTSATRSYRETLDQAALTAVFDLREARAAASFDKCYRDVAAMLAGLRDTRPRGGQKPPN
jgi:hypothetical protein